MMLSVRLLDDDLIHYIQGIPRRDRSRICREAIRQYKRREEMAAKCKVTVKIGSGPVSVK